MEVSAADIRGTITNVQVAVIVPGKTTGASRPRQTSGGDGEPDSNAQVKRMVEQMQNHLDNMNISLQYSFYGSKGQKVAVVVVNKETGEVIREIPTKEMRALQTKVSELVGMIFNDHA